MKIQETVQNLTLSGINKKDLNYSRITPNAILMEILGSGLYKNAIGTVVRESISNAKDASIKHGVTTALEVHSPNILEPWYAVKDFGTGMSKKTLLNIFMHYGESDKREDNDQIGGFGIGSGSYISYSGQYTITTIHNGIKIVQQFLKDEKGMPCNVNLFEGPTNEQNGTEVKIAVNNTKDFSDFQKEIEFYGKWLDYEIKCNKQLSFKKPEFIYETTNFAITKETQNSMLAICGGVPYAVELRSIGNNLYTYSFSNSNIGGIKTQNLIFKANIGDVDFISSREELKYTEKTKSFIKQSIADIKNWYVNYKSSKTAFWLYQNPQPWESDQRYGMDYGFKIRYKSGSKWIVHDRAKAFKKYIAIDSIDDGRAWLVALRKINETPDTGAFILDKDKQALIKLGCPASDIIDFDSLPKLKRPKPKAYTKLIYDKNKLKRIKTDDVSNPINVNLATFQNSYQIKNLLIKLIRDDKQEVVLDDTKKCELAAFMEKKYGKKDTIDYCDTVDTLARLGYVKKLTTYTDDGYNSIRRLFNLVNGEKVELGDEFPLIDGKTYTSWYTPTGKIKDHMIKYIDMIIKENPKILKNKHLKVLK